MRYKDILPDVLAGKWVRHFKDDNNDVWYKMKDDGRFVCSDGSTPFCPSKEIQLMDTWEVKPEPEKTAEWNCRECFKRCRMYSDINPNKLFTGCKHNDRMRFMTGGVSHILIPLKDEKFLQKGPPQKSVD